MKTGRTLLDLAGEVERQAKAKRDFLAATSEISLQAEDNQLNLGEIGSFKIQDNFHSQLATHTGIPAQYYDKLRTEAPALLNQNVNHWLTTKPEKRMIRTLDNNARAFLSERYRPLDNYDLLETALPVMLQDKSLRIESCEVTERRLYIKAVTERVTYEIKKGDVVQAGIVLSNSEIGGGALSVEPLLFRLVCLNGMISNDGKMRKYHVGKGNSEFNGATEFFRDETRIADDKAFWMKVRDTIAMAFSQINFEKLAAKFFEAQEDKIAGDPIKVVELFRKQYGWNEGERNGVLTALLKNSDMTRFGMLNAVTEASQSFENYDRATEFERLGGTILELPRTDWKRLTETE